MKKSYPCPYCLISVKHRTWRRHLRKVHGVFLSKRFLLNGTPFVYPLLQGPFF